MKFSLLVVWRYLQFHYSGLLTLLVLGGTMGVILMLFTLWHLYLIMTNRTTNELSKYDRLQIKENVYRKGRRWDNFTEVFFPIKVIHTEWLIFSKIYFFAFSEFLLINFTMISATLLHWSSCTIWPAFTISSWNFPCIWAAINAVSNRSMLATIKSLAHLSPENSPRYHL